MKILKSLDQFGVPYQPRVQYQTEQHKTSIGGIVSIILYSLSFSYFIYILVQWRTGQLLPKITSQSDVQNSNFFYQPDQFIEIGLRRYTNTTQDPFDPQAIILQPQIIMFKNGQLLKEKVYLDFETIRQQNNFHTLKISNLTLSISDEKNDEFPEYELMIAFSQCQNETISQSQKCANQQQIKTFFAQPTNVIVIKQYASEFNTKTEKLETFGRETTFPLQQNKVHQIQNYIQLAQTTVDTGFLFESNTQHLYINEIRQSSATLDLEYYNKFYFDIYMAFQYKLDNIQLNYHIIYPKLSEILAETGSITSTLLLLSFIIQIINKNQLDNEAIDSVISMYYPDFKNIRITRNFFGKITKVEKNKKQIEIKIFKEIYDKWSKISQKKLSLSNQLYEISRIQFVLTSFCSQNQLSQIHNYGISLPNFLVEFDESYSKFDINLNQDFQYKSNQIIPNLNDQSQTNTRSSPLKLQVIPQTESQSVFKESDFDLFVQPDDENIK